MRLHLITLFLTLCLAPACSDETAEAPPEAEAPAPAADLTDDPSASDEETQAPVEDDPADEPAEEETADAPRGTGEIIAAAGADDWRTVDPSKLFLIELDTGTVAVELSSDLTQRHVDWFTKLVREGYYDGLTFYRVIDGFVAQGGVFAEEREPKSVSGNIKAEFDEPIPSGLGFTPIGVVDGYADEAGFINGFPAGRSLEEDRAWLAHCAGAFAFGRENEADTASTEFYITLHPHRYLDRNLSVFGRVLDGMSHLQKLNRVAPTEDGKTVGEGAPGVIKRMVMADDLPKDERPSFRVFNTNSDLFKELIQARRNRPEPFFHYRPDHTDICAVPIPVEKGPFEE